VDLVRALEALRRHAEALGYPLQLYGLGVYTSSVIYRLKVETLFEGPARRRSRPAAPPLSPPPILDRFVMPFRKEPALQSPEELLAALEELLKEMREGPREAPQALQPLEEGQPPEPLSASLEEYMRRLRVRLEELSGIRGELFLSGLLEGMEPLEAARIFLCLLFLAQEGKILLEQDEEDVRIVAVGG
jgi:chromatin segregation and condensation protein Rec8/ScpA/Scc1 (kleisin family)